MTQSLLSVEGLNVRFHTTKGVVEAVRGISFEVGREKLGIVGESGSGKTMTGRSVLRLVRPPGEVVARRMTFDGVDLMRLSEVDMREIRGRRIAMVMQDPKFSLNPVMTVGSQIAEAYLVHHKVAAAQARARTLDMLAAVKIRDPERVYGLYPHECSGGMGQHMVDGVARVERAVGVLEHHLDQLVEGLAAILAQHLAVDPHGAGPVRVEARKRPQDGRLAGSRFADQTEGLALLDPEGGAADGADRRRALAEGDRQVLDLDHDRISPSTNTGPSRQAGSRESTERSPTGRSMRGSEASRPRV